MTNNDLIRRSAASKAAMNVAVFSLHASQSEINAAVLVLAHVEKALAAIPAADPVPNADSQQRVTVKPLAWVKHPTATIWRADTAIGSYKVFTTHGVTWDFDSATDRTDGTPKAAKDADAAFASAQADYAARILATINVQPDPRDAQIARLVGAVTAEIEARNLFLSTVQDRGGSHGPKGQRKIALENAQLETVFALKALKGGDT